MIRIGLVMLLGVIVARPGVAQTTDSTFPTSVARMYAASTTQAWTDVLKVLADNGIKSEIQDDDGRFLITRPIQVDAKRFGFTLTDVLANASNGRVKLHVFVPRFIEPARVYVGSTLTVEVSAEYSRARAQMLLYNLDAFGDWFLAKVSKQLALPAYRIPQQPAQRAKLARSLIRGGNEECLRRIESGDQRAHANGDNWVAPRKVHNVPAIYPRSGVTANIERDLRVDTVIGEDGFLWPIGVTGGAPADDFAITALGTIPLWRFTPLVVEGCPAPTPTLTVSLAFVIK
jgi:hypothetical protein